jgi:hypothetical protein
LYGALYDEDGTLEAIEDDPGIATLGDGRYGDWVCENGLEKDVAGDAVYPSLPPALKPW